MKLQLTNSFHNTVVKTTKTRAEIDKILETHPANRTPAEKAWVARTLKKLCGVRGCTCANDIGER